MTVIALMAAALATGAPVPDKELLDLYQAEIVDLRIGGTYDCDPPGEERFFDSAIKRMKRIKPVLTQRVGEEAMAQMRIDADEGFNEVAESVSFGGCKRNDEAFDRRNLDNIKRRHLERLRALEAGLGL